MENLNEISMEGFQVVSSDFFCTVSRVSAPTITVWDGSIGFSKQDLILLNSCENVIMQVNAPEKKILVIPTTSRIRMRSGGSRKQTRSKQGNSAVPS